MAAAMHTPGPWRRNGTLIEGPQMALEIASVRPHGTVGFSPRSDAEASANARVIAAAPEMLAALKWLNGSGLPDGPWREMVRAAIHLAETGERA